MSKKKKKSKKFKSHSKQEILDVNNDVDLNIDETKEQVLENKNILREKEEEIEKERLKLIALNKSGEKDQVEESIQEKEEKLRKLLLERRELKQQLLNEKQKKKVSLKEVVEKKEQETIVVDDNFEYEYVDEDRNVFKVFIDSVKYYTAKYIFRKNIERLEYVRKARHGHKFKILFSLIFTLIMITLVVLFMRYFSTTKDTYGDYMPNNATTTVTTQSSVESTNNNETTQSENNNSSELAELASKEESAANSTYNPGITLPVAKEIKTLEILTTYQSSGWANKVGSVEKDTTLSVNAVSFPGGYMMYQIAAGPSAGQYISANPKLVEVTSNNDATNFEFINYPLAISPSEEQDVFEDKELTKAKGKVSVNSTHNVKGYGVANNRLVYHLEDGSYLPFSATVNQVQR
ncbi:MAG: hypothetical protein Q3988_02235 [Gemella sp.]|nr:hypothetical protein [Gemella sp.]